MGASSGFVIQCDSLAVHLESADLRLCEEILLRQRGKSPTREMRTGTDGGCSLDSSGYWHRDCQLMNITTYFTLK